MRELCAEAEADDEAVEAVGVEKISADCEILFKFGFLLVGERLVQFGLEVALFLHQLFHAAARADAALVRGYISVV